MKVCKRINGKVKAQYNCRLRHNTLIPLNKQEVLGITYDTTHWWVAAHIKSNYLSTKRHLIKYLLHHTVDWRHVIVIAIIQEVSNYEFLSFQQLQQPMDKILLNAMPVWKYTYMKYTCEHKN
jgi:hypothetical protein